jgi:hypothetical protein
MSGQQKIDRKALISRHTVVYKGAAALDTCAPLSVGNGDFCFTADFTGLQSVPQRYSGFPLCTMAGWGWHSYAGAPTSAAGLRLTEYDTWGRPVGYATDETGQEALFKGLRQNAHKFHLGRIGFTVDGADSDAFAPVQQELSLWEGVLSSVFTVSGERVVVETFVHPDEDTLCIRAASPLIAAGTVGVSITFPYGSHKKAGADFSVPRLHTTALIEQNERAISLARTMDATVYTVTIAFGSAGARAAFDGEHKLRFSGGASGVLELAVRFSAGQAVNAPSGFVQGRAACAAFWERYWSTGGALDLSESRDSRAGELERRVVLSQYLTAIQSRGALPSAETGLSCNSWYGKFHLEMHYWHAAHFALWGRAPELARSLAYYQRILPVARRLAAAQGYRGARWPKMCDPSGCNTPSSIAVLLVWQQVHPILLAELCYRALPDPGFLHEYREVIQESATFMRDFIHWDGERFVLGPPLMPAQERHDPRIVLNPGYETAYFRWGLRQANVWRARLGEEPCGDFAQAAGKLSAPAAKGGVYLAHENCPGTFTTAPFYTDHPSMLAMLGCLPGEGISRRIMSDTLDRVIERWDFSSLWGWDFPMMAMTACRLGRREDAVRLLLLDSPKNTYLPNGHNRQTGADDLPLYLPGNGGLLLAVAMMAAGFDGSETAPGFPTDGSFTIHTEGLRKYV